MQRALEEKTSYSKRKNDVENYAFLSLVLIHHSSIKSIAYPTWRSACSSATCNESTSVRLNWRIGQTTVSQSVLVTLWS